MATQKMSLATATQAKAETERTIADIFDVNYQLSAFDPPIVGGGGGINTVVGGEGITIDNTDPANPIIDNDTALLNFIVVNQSNKGTTLGGVIDSTSEYFIDGVIDMGATQITVPSTGISIRGYDFNTSQLTSSQGAYTMFIGATAGDVLMNDVGIDVSGAGSQVFDLVGNTGFEAFEINRVNWNNCTSMGELDTYRQGLEVGTGRFGGTPTLTLSGTWVGGYFIDTSIVRNLDNAMNAPLFAAGTAFLMSSRFRSNQNIDLGTTAEFFDFAPANFLNPSTVQLDGCLITRNGVFDPEDTTVIPNMLPSDLVASWINNIGIDNTFIGGRIDVTSETATTILVQGDFYALAGTWTTGNLDHFDSPSNGQLRHIGFNPREFRGIVELILDGPANDEVEVRLRKWDDSASSFVTVGSQLRQVNSLAGGRNVAFFTAIFVAIIDQNDYVFLEVANNSGTDNLTAEISSFLLIEER